MKIRDSGMPSESVWQSFFDPEIILIKLGLKPDMEKVVDFGCGYGTFSIAAAKLTNAKIYALDIDAEILELATNSALKQGLGNIRFKKRDFVSNGTEHAAQSIDFAMMFNLLHMEHPQVLLAEAHRILKPNGKLAIMHWNHDASTPRGPALSIRPKPDQIVNWAKSAGFSTHAVNVIDLPPYHYGLVVSAPDSNRSQSTD
jgi:SAM-dependent methyltransferase